MFELNSSYFIYFFKSSWCSNMCRRINKALTSLRMYSVDYIYKTSVVKGANCCIHLRKVWCWSLNLNYLPLVCLHIIYLNSTLILPLISLLNLTFLSFQQQLCYVHGTKWISDVIILLQMLLCQNMWVFKNWNFNIINIRCLSKQVSYNN